METQKSRVLLTSAQVAHLIELTTRGTAAVKTYRRATALLALHAGQRYTAVAQRLADRFELYYTLKCGSWLNQVELDFSALSRQCLKRRIPTLAQLAYQACCWSRECQAQAVKIHR